MPQDTIWLNPEKTDYIIDAPIEEDNIIYAPSKEAKKEYIPVKTSFQKKSDDYSQWALPITIVMLAAIWIIIRMRFGKSKGYIEIGSTGEPYTEEPETSYVAQTDNLIGSENCLTYNGKDLNFTTQELTDALAKRSPFFVALNAYEKERFIGRLKKFIAIKVFKIHANGGFKEMPILISASAIQTSFGLENYMLPDFPTIHIYPDVFYRIDHTIKFLEGNVSNGCINISWKYFLHGYQVPNDGQNVGLHEMAHAYYFQNLQCTECEDKRFKASYNTFELQADQAFNREKQPGYDLYTDYALTNIQEFWAESVEIFFEKPVILKANYPELYNVIKELLNQDTARSQL